VAAKPHLDFGPKIPVAVTSEAETLLDTFPQATWLRVKKGLQKWVSTAPVKAAWVNVATDHDYPEWKDLVIELLVDADTDRAIELWDEVAAAIAEAKQGMTPVQRAKIDELLSVELLWGADSGDVEPTCGV
jgi:hypothetical protein